jgi:hypothetical protein
VAALVLRQKQAPPQKAADPLRHAQGNSHARRRRATM